MRAIIYRTKRVIQLAIILTMTLLICIMIWKLFMSKNRIAEDYRMLAEISPADIISYQKDKPAAWKDYVAVITACNNTKIEGKTNNLNMEDLKKNLLLQLNSDISFQQLNWFNANKEIKHTAQKIHTILKNTPSMIRNCILFPWLRPAIILILWCRQGRGKAQSPRD